MEIALNPNVDVIVGGGIGGGILLVTVIIGIALCVCCFFFFCKKGSNRSDKKSSKVQSSDMQMQLNILHYKLQHMLLTHIMFKLRVPHILQIKQ